MTEIEKNLAEVREKIADAAKKSGRSAEDITLVAVTKTHPVEAINEAIDLGVTDIGENKVQEIMEKYAWMAKIKPGMKDEYVRRHDEIWPELVELLKSAGICNYTIWTDGETLFGYYECEKGIDFAAKTQAQSPIVDKWNEYMKDVMEMPLDPVTGAQPKLVNVFTLD